jgi:stage II sporulation protein M
MPDKAFKHCVIIASGIFLIAIIIGYLAPIKQKEMISRDLSALFAPIKTLSPPAILLFIFLNNALKASIAILMGFLFGLVPLLFISGNGYVLGLLISLAQSRMGISEIVLRILPHALFEIPAFIIAGAFGLWLGGKFIRKIRYREEFRPFLFLSMKNFFKIVAPLLLIAALIETFITPFLAGITL